MIDGFNRKVDYLRISVTDRCNLRCIYCMPENGIELLPESSMLSNEEITKIVKIGVGFGIENIRITGGEPLVRLGIVDLVDHIAQIDGLEEISMTTNGVLLSKFAKDLAKAGLKRVNISLDTYNRQKYSEITRRDNLPDVFSGIEAAACADLSPIKINMVIMRGINDQEISGFARLTMDYPLEIRFIEYMPMVCGTHQNSPVSGREIKQILEGIGLLRPIAHSLGNGPAQYYKYIGARGTVGLITSFCQHYCGECNWLQLTADGHLRSCLFSDQKYDIKSLVRNGASDEAISNMFLKSNLNKPCGHQLVLNRDPSIIRGIS